MSRASRGSIIGSIAVLLAAHPAHAVPTGNAFVPLPNPATPCPRVLGISDAANVHFAPDGAFVYTVGSQVSVWTREAGTGLLRWLETESGLPSLHGPQTRSALSPDATSLYVASAGTTPRHLMVFARDAGTGTLALVQTIVVDGVGLGGLAGPRDVAVSPDGEHVYVVGFMGTSGFPAAITSFDRDVVTGTLTFIETLQEGQAGISGPGVLTAVATTSDGRFVHALGYNGFPNYQAVLTTFARNASTGQLSVQSQAFATIGQFNFTDALFLTPDDAFAYAGVVNAGSVALFSLDATSGAATWQPPLDAVGSLFVLADDGLQAYARGSDVTNTVARDPLTGHLSVTGTASTNFNTRGFGISPDGANVYVTFGDGMAVYARDGTTGALTRIDTVRGTTSGPSAITLAPGAEHVYAICAEAVVALARDATTGVLTPVDTLEQSFEGVDGLEFPSWLVISPDGKHVYVGGHLAEPNFSTVITILQRNTTDGSLTFVGYQGCYDLTGNFGHETPRISPDGRNLYFGSDDYVTLAVLDRDATSGFLSTREQHLPTDPGVSGLESVNDVLVSPDGFHVYTAARQGITVWARTPATGALTFLEHQVFGTGVGLRLVATEDGGFVYLASTNGLNVLVRNAVTGHLDLREVEQYEIDLTFTPNVALAVVPDGRHVLYHPDGPTRVFRRDLVSGRLGDAGPTPAGFTFTPDSRHAYGPGSTTISLHTRKVVCDGAPRDICRAPTLPRKSTLQFTNHVELRRNRLTWKWSAGEETLPAALGDPTTSTDYAICVYDASAEEQPVIAMDVPAGGCPTSQPCWRPKGDAFVYMGRPPNVDGVTSLLVRSGAPGRSQAKLKASGGGLPLPTAPLVPGIVAQIQASNGECWGATFGAPSLNADGRFKASSD